MLQVACLGSAAPSHVLYTTDDIEVRWCSDQDLGNEATATELLEILVK